MTLFTYFPRAKHSSLTVTPLAARTDVGKCTSILGSYSPMIPGKVKKRELQVLESSRLTKLLSPISHHIHLLTFLFAETGHNDLRITWMPKSYYSGIHFEYSSNHCKKKNIPSALASHKTHDTLNHPVLR